MSERGMPGDGPPACPFIAFADERDERSSSPDHRHRCYAEVTPAPRALAHQEAYCLSSAFPVCPTFQDWARREAAQARAAGRSSAGTEGVAVAVVRDGSSADDEDGTDASDDDDDPVDDAPEDAAELSTDDAEDLWSGGLPTTDPPARRNPPRDWAAPPPWAAGAGAAGSAGRGPRDDHVSDLSVSRVAGAGLAGSAADRLASGRPAAVPPPAAEAGPTPTSTSSSSSGPPASSESSGSPAAPASSPSDELAGLVAPAPGRAPVRQPPLTRPPSGAHPTSTASGRRPTVSSTRTRAPAPDHDGPSWETARRYEAYPTIKTRAGLPGIPRVLIWVAALAIAAVALFFLPDVLDLLGGGGAATPIASPSSSTAATAEPSPTPVAAPTPQTYTIKKNDTLLKIAKKYGLTLDELLAANKDTIKNADKIKVGQVIVIPAPAPSSVTDPSAPAPSASDSPAP